jgi:hexulose-6-phosphate isomerase
MQLAADCGFEGIEVLTPEDDRALDEIKAASEKTKLPVHSVMSAANWKMPLTSPDPSVASTGFAGAERSLRYAKALGATTILLVPGIVDPKTSYQEAWSRSQAAIRKLLPLAREVDVIIAVENVGNHFLLSPLEFVKYVEDFNDPHLRAYFDIGNCLYLFGYPQDWIRTLGKHIAKFHVKDVSKDRKFVMLRDGDVDWKAVRSAIGDIGYTGYLSAEPNQRVPELDKGFREYVRELSHRMDLIFNG